MREGERFVVRGAAGRIRGFTSQALDRIGPAMDWNYDQSVTALTVRSNVPDVANVANVANAGTFGTRRLTAYLVP